MAKTKQLSICSGCVENFEDKFLNVVLKDSHGFQYTTVYCDRCVDTLKLEVVRKVKIVKPKVVKEKTEEAKIPVRKTKKTK